MIRKLCSCGESLVKVLPNSIVRCCRTEGRNATNGEISGMNCHCRPLGQTTSVAGAGGQASAVAESLQTNAHVRATSRAQSRLQGAFDTPEQVRSWSTRKIPWLRSSFCSMTGHAPGAGTEPPRPIECHCTTTIGRTILAKWWAFETGRLARRLNFGLVGEDPIAVKWRGRMLTLPCTVVGHVQSWGTATDRCRSRTWIRPPETLSHTAPPQAAQNRLQGVGMLFDNPRPLLRQQS